MMTIRRQCFDAAQTPEPELVDAARLAGVPLDMAMRQAGSGRSDAATESALIAGLGRLPIRAQALHSLRAFWAD